MATQGEVGKVSSLLQAAVQAYIIAAPVPNQIELIGPAYGMVQATDGDGVSFDIKQTPPPPNLLTTTLILASTLHHEGCFWLLQHAHSIQTEAPRSAEINSGVPESRQLTTAPPTHYIPVLTKCQVASI